MALLGAHESVGRRLHLAFDRIRQVGGEVLQIFTRNQRQWRPAELTAQEIDLFRAAHEESGGMPVASHASYLVNLASSQEGTVEKSVPTSFSNCSVCRALGIPVCRSASRDRTAATALRPVSTGLSQVLTGLSAKAVAEVQVLVETTSGQGTGLGQQLQGTGLYPEQLQISTIAGRLPRYLPSLCRRIRTADRGRLRGDDCRPGRHGGSCRRALLAPQ